MTTAAVKERERESEQEYERRIRPILDLKLGPRLLVPRMLCSYRCTALPYQYILKSCTSEAALLRFYGCKAARKRKPAKSHKTIFIAQKKRSKKHAKRNDRHHDVTRELLKRYIDKMTTHPSLFPSSVRENEIFSLFRKQTVSIINA